MEYILDNILFCPVGLQTPPTHVNAYKPIQESIKNILEKCNYG